MGMTEQQEQIAKEVSDGLAVSPIEKSLLICGIERFLCVLPKPEPFGYVYESVSQAFDSVHCGTIYSLNADDGRIPLYSEPVIAKPSGDYMAERDALLEALREIDRHMEEAGFNVGGPIEHCHDEISHVEAMRLLSLAQEYMKDVIRLAGRAIASVKGAA